MTGGFPPHGNQVAILSYRASTSAEFTPAIDLVALPPLVTSAHRTFHRVKNRRIVYEFRSGARSSLLSVLDTVPCSEYFGVERESIVRTGVLKAERRPDTDRSPDHAAVDETVIQPIDAQYRQYTAVGSKFDNPLYRQFRRGRGESTPSAFVRNCCETHDLADAAGLGDSDKPLNDARY